MTESERDIDLDQADLFTSDSIATAEASARLKFSRELSEKLFDYSIGQSERLLNLKFTNTDKPLGRSDNLEALKCHVASNQNKLIKIFSYLSVSEKLTKENATQMDLLAKLLEDSGINQKRELSKRLEYVETILPVVGIVPESNFNLQLFSEKFEKIQQQLEQIQEDDPAITIAVLRESLTEVENKLIKVETAVDSKKLTGILERLETLSTSVVTLQPLKESLQQLSETVNTLTPQAIVTQVENRMKQAEAATNADRQAAKRDLEETRLALEEIRRIKTAIDQSPAGSAIQRATLGTAKIPELKSLDPSEFRTWRDLFNVHAKLQNWTEAIKHSALKLAVPESKIYVPLKLATPNWDDLSSKEILAKWEKRCCPDSHRDLAVTQLSQLHQTLDEGSLSYIDRAVELYITAQFEEDLRDPEDDRQFVHRLINTFRDTRLRGPLQRRKPETISQLRIALNEEMNIIENDPSTTSQVAAVSAAASINKVSGVDGKNSNEKTPLRCYVCGEPHFANKCEKAFAIINMYKKQFANNSNSNQKGNQNQNNQGGGNQQNQNQRGRGRGRGGRGRGGKRGNFDPSRGGGAEGPPPPKAQKFQKYDDQKN